MIWFKWLTSGFANAFKQGETKLPQKYVILIYFVESTNGMFGTTLSYLILSESLALQQERLTP